MATAATKDRGALDGVRILDMGTVLAAPFGVTLCADLGADVVKLELPCGSDPLRALEPVKDGQALYWKVANRGKRGITLDVRKPRGKALFLKLLSSIDVLVENFRSGTLERWGLDFDTLLRANPHLIVLRMTGFGQTGPYRDRPGFARVFEAMSGFTNLCGVPGGAPLHMNLPIGDLVTGLFTGFSIAAEIARQRRHPDAPGRQVDLAAAEALLRLMDPLAVEHEQKGFTRTHIGSRTSYASPSNMYRSHDGVYFTMVASSDAIFRRLATAIGRPELPDDALFVGNVERVRNGGALDEILLVWFGARSFAEITTALAAAAIPFSKVNTIEDILQDPQFSARAAIVRLRDPDLGSIPAPCIVPRVVGHSMGTPRSGPGLGEHNREVYARLGVDAAELAVLHAEHVI